MKLAVWLMFPALCLLSSAGWLLSPAGSDALPSLERQGLLYGAVGLVALSARRRIWKSTVFNRKVCGLQAWKTWSTKTRRSRWASLALAGIGFFGVPSVFFEQTAGSLSGVGRSVCFAMVPIVVVLVVAAAAQVDEGARRSLAPALVGLAGVLLLLPFDLPSSARGRWMLGGLALVVILVAVLGVWLHRLLQQFEWSDALIVVSLSNAALLLLVSFLSESFIWRGERLASVWTVSSLSDGIAVVLLLWLLRAMDPVRLAARYLLIPLFTVLEGFAFLRPELTARMAFGTLLLAIGAGVLLLKRESKDAIVLSIQ